MTRRRACHRVLHALSRDEHVPKRPSTSFGTTTILGFTENLAERRPVCQTLRQISVGLPCHQIDEVEFVDQNLDEEYQDHIDNTNDDGSSIHDEDPGFEVGGFTPTCSQSQNQVEAVAGPKINIPSNLSAANHEFNDGIFPVPEHSSHSSISEQTLPRLHLLDHFEQSPASVTSGSSYPVDHDRLIEVPSSGTFSSHLGLARDTSIVQANLCLFPLPDDDATLLHYFVTDLCSWFDYCDKKRHFLNVAIPAAATDSTLLDAILAVSAKHLSLNGKFDRYASDKYQQRCLEKLIPALNDQKSLLDENLFAATIILRLLDEMTEPIGTTQGHILGTHFLVRARQEPASESSLREACLVVGLRQDIFISFTTQRPLRPLAGYCHIDRSLSAADDWTWAHRIIAHTADILNYCYGNKPRGVEAWKALNSYTDEWESLKPASFTPIKDVIAEPSKVAGNQYLGICRILLLSYNPQTPQLGIERKTADREQGLLTSLFLKENIKNQVSFICGIAISNRQFLPAMFTAGMAIAMCGERFTDPVEQHSLLDILVEAEGHVAWPSLKFQDTMKSYWGI
ncbi:hypothetical protein LARI1_G008533 [Lachnellula arida]|uniref:Arca-like protein n=1 Tax=Lachnellula arida TaxID=1316785 RepID=A0A8T9B306_9HELO|nr:hypothetical protein LARI1_G008533 [Lachnellula arida]